MRLEPRTESKVCTEEDAVGLQIADCNGMDGRGSVKWTRREDD